MIRTLVLTYGALVVGALLGWCCHARVSEVDL